MTEEKSTYVLLKEQRMSLLQIPRQTRPSGRLEFYPKRGRGFWDKFYLVFFFNLVIIGIEWKLAPSDA